MSVDSISVEESTQHLTSMHQLAAPFFGHKNQPLADQQINEHLGKVEPIAFGQLPAAYDTLLNHRGHMTVTLEAWHNTSVDVHVMDEESSEEFYSRHSLLTRQTDGRVVQSGIMKIQLAGLPAEARRAIKEGSEPLGRILIRSNLLREVELLALWQIEPGAQLAKELDLDKEKIVFGRTASILVDGNPAVELLEIVKP